MSPPSGEWLCGQVRALTLWASFFTVGQLYFLWKPLFPWTGLTLRRAGGGSTKSSVPSVFTFQWPKRSCCSVAKPHPTLSTPWSAAGQASQSFTVSWSLPKFMSVELVIPSNHHILCPPASPPLGPGVAAVFPPATFGHLKVLFHLLKK